MHQACGIVSVCVCAYADAGDVRLLRWDCVQVARYVQSLRVTKATKATTKSGGNSKMLESELAELKAEVDKAKEQLKVSRKAEKDVRVELIDLKDQVAMQPSSSKQVGTPRGSAAKPKREASPTRARSPEPKTESAGVKAAEQDMSKVCACVAMMTVVEMAWC